MIGSLIVSFLYFLLCTMMIKTMSLKMIMQNKFGTPIYKSTITSMAETSNEIRTFAAYAIYKGKGAVNVKPIGPTFSPTGAKGRTVARDGAMLFEFAPTTSPKEYDWTNKVSFSLSPTECGELLVMKKETGIEFFHDPNMGGEDQGKVTKKMKWTPTQDGKGMFLSFAITDPKSGNKSYSVPVTWGEIEVISTITRYCLPRLLGIDQVLTN